MIYQQFKNAATGGVVNNLNSDLVRKIKIPIPPIINQNEIVKKLQLENEYLVTVKKVIELYEQKIRDRVAKIWGE
jgi:restriction endonuclease S subunit